jgi:hypothetical protein
MLMMSNSIIQELIFIIILSHYLILQQLYMKLVNNLLLFNFNIISILRNEFVWERIGLACKCNGGIVGPTWVFIGRVIGVATLSLINIRV